MSSVVAALIGPGRGASTSRWWGRYIGLNIMRQRSLRRCFTRICKFIVHGTSSNIFYKTEEQGKVLQNLFFSSDSLICLINCKRCITQDPSRQHQYIGQTSKKLGERFGENRRVFPGERGHSWNF